MIDVTQLIDVQLGGVDPRDWPDMVDARVESACHPDGRLLNEEELDYLNCYCAEWIQEQARREMGE